MAVVPAQPFSRFVENSVLGPRKFSVDKLHEIDWDALSNEWNLQNGSSSRTSPHRVNFTTQSSELNLGRCSLESRLSPLLPARGSDAHRNRWTEDAIEDVLRSTTNPIGKFLRDMNMSAKDALRLDIMPYLDMAPRKQRGKYGKRQQMSAQEKLKISRERNREHARATRLRRKVFEVVLDDQLAKLQNSIEVAMRCSRVLSKQQLLHNITALIKALDSDAVGDCQLVSANFQLHFQLTHTAAASPELAVQSALFCGKNAAGECMRGLLDYMKSTLQDCSQLSRSSSASSDASVPRIITLPTSLELQSPHCLTPNSAFNIWSPLKDISPFPLTLSPTLPEEESCMDEAPFAIPTRGSPVTSDSPEPLSPLSVFTKSPPKRIRLALCDPCGAIIEGIDALVPYVVYTVSSDGTICTHRSSTYVFRLRFSGIECNNTNNIGNPTIVRAHIDIDMNGLLQ